MEARRNWVFRRINASFPNFAGTPGKIEHISKKRGFSIKASLFQEFRFLSRIFGIVPAVSAGRPEPALPAARRKRAFMVPQEPLGNGRGGGADRNGGNGWKFFGMIPDAGPERPKSPNVRIS
jgi:hypothetical protein